MESAVRVLLLLLVPAALCLIGAAGAAGGAWVLLLAPAGLVLAVHARLVACVSVRPWGGAAANVAIVAAGAIFAVLAVGPSLGLYRTVTVLSGSMRPTFSPGDVLVVTPHRAEDLGVGEVITYETPGGQVETHRVVRIFEAGHEPVVGTRGDANSAADPWRAKLHGGTIWRYRLRVPLAGRIVLALREPLLHRLLVFVLPALLAVAALRRVWLPSRVPALVHERGDAA